MSKTQIDEFGCDPSIRRLRRVFSRMETVSKELIAKAGISPFDPRLRRWREAARELFERGWAKAVQKNLSLTEEEAGILYGFALQRLMERDGISPESLVLSGMQDARILKIAELAT